ncbi:hypothetical protein ACUY4R_001764 [Kosakonia sp. BK9b]
MSVLNEWTQPFKGLCLYYPGHRHIPDVFAGIYQLYSTSALTIAVGRVPDHKRCHTFPVQFAAITSRGSSY